MKIQYPNNMSMRMISFCDFHYRIILNSVLFDEAIPTVFFQKKETFQIQIVI